MEMTEAHLCLLENFELAERVATALYELDEFVKKAITGHLNELVARHLGERWELDEDYWQLKKSAWDGAYFYFRFVDDNSEDYTLAHLLGVSADGGYQFALHFEDLLKSSGKSQAEIEQVVQRHLGSLAAFKTLQRVATTKRQLSYRRPLRLDRDALYKALESGTVARGDGIAPFDDAIQDIKVLAPGIDALLEEMQGTK